MKKRYTEEQINGFLREADAGLPFRGTLRIYGCGAVVPEDNWRTSCDC